MILRFLKETYEEYNGIDIIEKNRIEREERKKQKIEYKKNNAIPKWAKKGSIIITAYFVFIAVFDIYGSHQQGKIANLMLNVFLLICSIVGTTMMNINRKSYQKIGSAFFTLFLIIHTFKTMI